MTRDKQERAEILQEIEALCTMHERLTQCDSVQRARDTLQRLRDLARENLENDKD